MDLLLRERDWSPKLPQPPPTVMPTTGDGAEIGDHVVLDADLTKSLSVLSLGGGGGGGSQPQVQLHVQSQWVSTGPLPLPLPPLSTPSLALALSPPATTTAHSLYEEVMQAAVATANALRAPQEEADMRRDLFKCCQQKDKPPSHKMAVRLQGLLRDNPSLANARAAGEGNIASDGATPLHCAAQWDNTDAIQVLLAGPEPVEGTGFGAGASAWSVDLQGRTPLHIAAEWGKEAAARVLREAMAREKQVNPVGPLAPTDLTGSTPLVGYTAISTDRPSIRLLLGLICWHWRA